MLKGKLSLEKYGLVFSLVGVTALFAVLTGGKLFTPMNVSNIFMQNAYLIILSVSMYFCLSTKNVDLSVGSVVAVSGAMLGFMTVINNYSFGLAVAVILIMGVVIGLIQGSIIAFLGVPAFICTLGMELVLRGLTVILLDSRTLGPFSPVLQYLSAGFLFPDAKIGGLNLFCVVIFIVGAVAIIVNELLAIRRKKKYNFDVPAIWMTIVKLAAIILAMGFVMLGLARYNGMPVILGILILLVLLYSYIANGTAFGRRVFAVGANRNAAKLSGVQDKRVIMTVFVNAGILSSFAGLMVAGRLNAATSIAGVGYELEAISAVSIAGGATAGIFGTFIGAAVMAVLNNGLSVLGLGADVQKVIKGIVVLFAVAFDIYSKSKSEK